MGLEQEMSFVKPPVVVALRSNTRILLETHRGFGSKALLSDASFFFFFLRLFLFYFIIFYFFIFLLWWVLSYIEMNQPWIYMHLFTRESAGCWLISIRMRQERNQEIC